MLASKWDVFQQIDPLVIGHLEAECRFVEKERGGKGGGYTRILIVSRYANNISKQERDIAEFQKEENSVIPKDTDYWSLGGLSTEGNHSWLCRLLSFAPYVYHRKREIEFDTTTHTSSSWKDSRDYTSSISTALETGGERLRALKMAVKCLHCIAGNNIQYEGTRRPKLVLHLLYMLRTYIQRACTTNTEITNLLPHHHRNQRAENWQQHPASVLMSPCFLQFCSLPLCSMKLGALPCCVLHLQILAHLPMLMRMAHFHHLHHHPMLMRIAHSVQVV